MIIKLAAASAAAYGLYRLIARRNDDTAKFQPAAPALAAVPADQRGPYVSPI